MLRFLIFYMVPCCVINLPLDVEILVNLVIELFMLIEMVWGAGYTPQRKFKDNELKWWNKDGL